MAESGVIFSGEAADRIAATVEWAEDNGLFLDRRRMRRGTVQTPETFDARITSATVDANGHYPAVVTVWDGDAGAWVDYEPSRVKPRNGETLVNGRRYSVRAIGESVVSGTTYPLYILSDTLGGAIVSNATFSAGTWHVSGHLVESCSILSLDTATGISASNISSTDDDDGTDVLLSLAAATTGQWGVVTTTTQAFAGIKSVGSGLFVGTFLEVLTAGTPIIMARSGNSSGVPRGGVYITAAATYASDVDFGTETLNVAGRVGTAGSSTANWDFNVGGGGAGGFSYEIAAGGVNVGGGLLGGGARSYATDTSAGSYVAEMIASAFTGTTFLNLSAFNTQQAVATITCQPAPGRTIYNGAIAADFNDGLNAASGVNGTLGGSGFLTSITCVGGWVTGVGSVSGFTGTVP